MARHPPLDGGAELDRLLAIALRGEDQLRHRGSEFQARRRTARLHHDRPTLRRAWQVEGALDREELSLVIELAHLARIDERPARAVGRDGAVFPAVPQP